MLRAFRADDLDPLLAFHSDQEAVRYVPYRPRDRAQVAAVLEQKRANTSLAGDGDLVEFAVELGETESLIGDAMLALRSAEHQTLEIGYIFHPGYGGQGFATETIRALVDLAFHVIGARRIIARVDTRNRRSCTLLDRVGFRREAHLVENEWLKGELTSEYEYGLLAREWPRSAS